MAEYINRDRLLEDMEKSGTFDGSAIGQFAIGMVRGAPCCQGGRSAGRRLDKP